MLGRRFVHGTQAWLTTLLPEHELIRESQPRSSSSRLSMVSCRPPPAIEMGCAPTRCRQSVLSSTSPQCPKRVARRVISNPNAQILRKRPRSLARGLRVGEASLTPKIPPPPFLSRRQARWLLGLRFAHGAQVCSTALLPEHERSLQMRPRPNSPPRRGGDFAKTKMISPSATFFREKIRDFQWALFSV